MLVMFSSSAEVLCYLEPDVTRSWSVLTALHSASGFIALVLANAFLNVCFVVLVFFAGAQFGIRVFFYMFLALDYNGCGISAV